MQQPDERQQLVLIETAEIYLLLSLNLLSVTDIHKLTRIINIEVWEGSRHTN